MEKLTDKIIRQKENLAGKALQVAEDSLVLLQDQMTSCQTRDLISIFNSAVKTHREISSDLISLSETESKEEEKLAKDYSPTVEKLLKRINPGNE